MKYILSFIILIVFASCATTNYLTIDIKEPAAITFPKEVKNLLIVNNSASGEVSHEEERDPSLAILSNDSAKAIMLNSLTKFINEEKYFDNVGLYPKRTNDSDSIEKVNPLSPSKVRALIRENKADALISLDLFAVSAGVESASVYFFNDYSMLSAHVGSILRVYGVNGNLIERPIVYLDSLFLSGEEDWSRRKNKIQELNGLISEISVRAADNLTSVFVPSWKTQTRWFFSDGSSEMKQATAFVAQEKWEEAADIWGALYDKETKRDKKIKLASNLALANECLDDIYNAQAWITIAFDLLPDKSNSELALHILNYKDILGKREKSRTKLFEQLGLEIIDDTPTEE